VNGYITTALIPKTDDSVDLGTAALAWQDAYFDGSVYTDTISELTGANGVTIDETKLKDGGVILKTGSEISDAGGKYVKINGGDGSGYVAAGYIGEVLETIISSTSSYTTTANTYVSGGNISLTAGVWLVMYTTSIDIANVGAGSAQLQATVRLYNATDASEVSNSRSVGNTPTIGNGVSQFVWMSNYVVVALSGTKTINLEVGVGSADTIYKSRFIADISGSITGADSTPKIIAIRIA
jgi:hypothetical protein